ncbi:MAG: hypothetical protein JSS69_12005 [Acidobacteria bacterium]|nr:hypothetical protein [Acidobacteriota bacterium]MBS1866628.1 hypothetical protein [Acidobacteriota bacterium]
MSGWNYFNYFTEIEEYFWKKRGANLLVSPLDWAIMESWQQAGVSLEAALKGIDRAFESHTRSRRGGKPMKSLAYCTDAVLEAAAEAKEAAAGGHSGAAAPRKTEPFSCDALRAHFLKNRDRIEQVAANTASAQPELSALLHSMALSLGQCSAILESPATIDLEDLERRLTVLDDKIHAALLQQAGVEMQLRLRREMDGQLALHRGKMRAEQIALIERQYLHKRLLEEFRLPRLSLFYLQH